MELAKFLQYRPGEKPPLTMFVLMGDVASFIPSSETDCKPAKREGGLQSQEEIWGHAQPPSQLRRIVAPVRLPGCVLESHSCLSNSVTATEEDAAAAGSPSPGLFALPFSPTCCRAEQDSCISLQGIAGEKP